VNENLPAYVPAFFILTTLAAVGFLFYAVVNAAGRSSLRYIIPGIVSFWLIFQASLALSGFYQVTDVLPPRIFAFAAFPALLFAVACCLFLRNDLISKLPFAVLTLLHVVRVPVEVTLYWLYEKGQVPEAMTFAGSNFDILSGITAPVVYYFAFRNGTFNRPLLLIWNIAALLLLVNIVGTAILAFPSPLQSIALDRPNVAVMYFPFVWLPAVVVPAVFFAHIAALYKLSRPGRA
jgi:hypothetical protein